MRTLDDFLVQVQNPVNFIKCDVEGAELLVFQGGLRTMARDQPIIFSEILRKRSAKFSCRPNEIFELFRVQGYRAFTVEGDSLKEFGTMDQSTVETNFFFLHAQKHAQHIQRLCK